MKVDARAVVEYSNIRVFDFRNKNTIRLLIFNIPGTENLTSVNIVTQKMYSFEAVNKTKLP